MPRRLMDTGPTKTTPGGIVGDKDTSAFDRIVEACDRLIEEADDDMIRRETESIRENASNLNLLAYRTRMLAERAHSLVGSDLPIVALQNVLQDAIGLVGAERGQILIWVDDQGIFDRIECSGARSQMTSLDSKVAETVAKRVFANNYPIVNPDLNAFPELDMIHELKNTRPLSIMAIPLAVEAEGHFERIGVIYLDAPAHKTTFTDTDVWVIKFLASLTALSIRNIRLSGALRLSYLDTVHALVRALEAKDPYTRGHSERVAEYAERVGKRFGLGTLRLKVLYSAALLHDIGKIGIRENVLNKPSKLTTDEYDHVKKHPEISESIMYGLTFLKEENEILVQHHERFDGKGYPKGLEADEISLEGAIIQVADAWDAMTSRRIYRKELDLEDALNELKDNAGTQFNPTVVDVFTQMIEAEGLVAVEEISNE